MKTYIYANSEIIAQHDGDHTANRYFYLHDRLGSVRQVIGSAGAVKNCYTYDPWGLPVGDETQTKETISNLYRFAGYVWDSEVSQYHCFRRQYDPVLARFTSRDPVQGDFKEPMTLHRYLYCNDDPLNRTDPSGELFGALDFAAKVAYGISAYYTGLDEGLKAAGGSYEGILDVAIAANAWREAYFDPVNLRKPIDTGAVFQGAIDKIANLCDWGGLGSCALGKFGSGLKKNIPLVILGEVSCGLCYSSPEPFSKTGFCAGCFIYRKTSTARNIATFIELADCIQKHCDF